MRLKLALTSFVFVAMTPAMAVHADAKAYSSALSARLVRFIYSPQQTYTIFTRPGMETDIQIPKNSQLDVLALGDTTRWITSDAGGGHNIFIKPVKAGIETSGTLVTTRETYQVMFVSRAKGKWYQQVKFRPASPVAVSNNRVEAQMQQQANQSAAAQAAHQKPVSHHASSHKHQHKHKSYNAFDHVDLSKIDFHWHIRGKAAFAPKLAFSSKQFVWMKMPKSGPSPVVFARNSSNQPWQIINYDRHGRWDVVQGSPSSIKLVANGHEVLVLSGKSKQVAHPITRDSHGRINPFGGQD